MWHDSWASKLRRMSRELPQEPRDLPKIFVNYLKIKKLLKVFNAIHELRMAHIGWSVDIQWILSILKIKVLNFLFLILSLFAHFWI